uniref:Uncharacterized protein n=1 Tax=Arundo donax TaxID=35708 RepID=A0A0A9A7S0_ARUDO
MYCLCDDLSLIGVIFLRLLGVFLPCFYGKSHTYK